MKPAIAAIIVALALGGCQPICRAFPEWNERGYSNDVEHTNGKVDTGVVKTAGQVAEIGIDPACWLGNQLGIIAGKPSGN